MNIKPLRNQVLIRLLPHEYTGLIFHNPDSPGMKRIPRKGVVIAIGKWRTTKQGLSVLPDFHVGQTVICNEYLGVKLKRDVGEHLRLCRIDDVLAVCETELNGVG